MKISIFTPVHDIQYLDELYQSIKDQAFDEWVIVPNHGAIIPDFSDPRIVQYPFESDYVGALKKFACSKATGDILVELDADDLLTPNAIEEIKKAFEDDKVGFVYSNGARFTNNFEKVERYGDGYGWQYRPFLYQGHELDEHVAWDSIPAAVSRIWYAPDHVRVWRKTCYVEAGGHPEDMRVLDDQDLLSRTFLITKFKKIDQCLYLYRITGKNTWLKHNQEIQNNVMRLYDKYILGLTEKWADDNKLAKIDLGSRLTCKPNYISVDIKDADVNCDLQETWPFPDSSVGVVIANDIFEHLKDPIHTMKELQRILAPDGYAFIQVPSTDGRGAFQDPTHKSFWNENSFLYYTNNQWAKYIDTPVRFQTLQLYTTEKNEQQVSWVVAHLINLKDCIRPPGIINI